MVITKKMVTTRIVKLKLSDNWTVVIFFSVGFEFYEVKLHCSCWKKRGKKSEPQSKGWSLYKC